MILCIMCIISRYSIYIFHLYLLYLRIFDSSTLLRTHRVSTYIKYEYPVVPTLTVCSLLHPTASAAIYLDHRPPSHDRTAIGCLICRPTTCFFPFNTTNRSFHSTPPTGPLLTYYHAIGRRCRADHIIFRLACLSPSWP
jgi:hypothetical protein